MPGVSKDQIAQAKEIDLLSYLRSREPHELVPSGPNEYRTKSHHSLVISNGLWHWVRGGVGGKTALDYLIHVRGCGFVDAVETLCGVRLTPSFSFQPVKNRAIPGKLPFVLPPKNGNNDRVIAYLRGRGIDGEIIKRCIDGENLYESTRGNCVFVGRDKSGVPRFACMRGTFSDFKQDVTGSNKRYGFCLSVSPDSRIVQAFESPVDALSAATLAKLTGEPWDNRHYLSLGGTSPLALLQFLKDRPESDHIVLSLDNDEAGRDGTRKVTEAIQGDPALAGKVFDITDAPPGHGKDCNDHLRHFIQEQKSISDPCRRRQAAISL